MKKIYVQPILKLLNIATNNIASISTGLNPNINWNEVEKDNWSDLFGDLSN